MPGSLRIPTGVLKTAAVVSIVAGATLTTAGQASAATIKPHHTHGSAATPNGGCTGDYGPYVKVLYDYGTVYHVVSGPWNDDNGTNYTATTSFSNTWSGTVSASISSNIKASGSVLAASVEASLGITVSLSATISGSHTVTYTVAPHSTLHAEYAEDQRHTFDQSYNLNSACTAINKSDGDSYLNTGSGWHTWKTGG